MNLILLLQFATTLMMTSLIWVMQINHYPAFKYIAEDKFKDFERFHIFRISVIVAPLMAIETVTAVLLYLNNTKLFWLSNLILIIIVWIVTVFFSMKYHKLLTKTKDYNILHKLLWTNWIRTIIWSIRSILIGYYLYLQCA